MKLTTIIIRNFRSFDDHADVIQVGEMAAFVGKNSSGKRHFAGPSAFLRANFSCARKISIMEIQSEP